MKKMRVLLDLLLVSRVEQLLKLCLKSNLLRIVECVDVWDNCIGPSYLKWIDRLVLGQLLLGMPIILLLLKLSVVQVILDCGGIWYWGRVLSFCKAFKIQKLFIRVKSVIVEEVFIILCSRRLHNCYSLAR